MTFRRALLGMTIRRQSRRSGGVSCSDPKGMHFGGSRTCALSMNHNELHVAHWAIPVGTAEGRAISAPVWV